MTVVSAMRFEKGGAMVADELATVGYRKLLDSEKITRFGECLIGNAGDVFFSNEVLDSIKKEATTPDEVFKAINEVSKELFTRRKDDYLQKKIGISLTEFLIAQKRLDGGGYAPLCPDLRTEADKVLKELDNLSQTMFLIASIEDGRFELSNVYVQGISSRKLPVTFYQTGSGSDLTQIKLSQYIGQMDAEAREKIDPAVGLVKLIEAEIASDDMNVGVGGIPQIAYMDETGQVKQPKQRTCRLATELVKGMVWNFLPEDFTYKQVESLVLGDATPEKVQELMQKKTGERWPRFDLALRGYRLE